MSNNNVANVVAFTLALTPENAGKIDAINRIVLGDDYTATAAEKPPAKETKAPAKETKAPAKAESDGMSFDEFKKACQVANKAHGKDFLTTVLEAAGVTLGATMAKTLSAVDEDNYAAIVEALEEGPQETEEEDDGFGEDDDLDDGNAVDAEAVKTALKAYAKEKDRDEAKEIMQKHGAATLAKVSDLDQKALIAIMKEIA